jgi:ketosteroid isomerase-like protein
MKKILMLSAFVCPWMVVAQYTVDSTAIIQLLIRDYATLENFDFPAHAANVTEDYYLIEDGDLWDIEREKEYYLSNAHRKLERKNYFDIHSVRVIGDMAYAIYTLQSEITENGAMKGRRWMESAIFRRSNSGWKLEVLHSTRIDLKE